MTLSASTLSDRVIAIRRHFCRRANKSFFPFLRLHCDVWKPQRHSQDYKGYCREQHKQNPDRSRWAGKSSAFKKRRQHFPEQLFRPMAKVPCCIHMYRPRGLPSQKCRYSISKRQEAQPSSFSQTFSTDDLLFWLALMRVSSSEKNRKNPE